MISNFNYLSILQLFQLLFPLITYPYLIRVLGKDIYGLVIYANTIAGYFLVFISFGFEISEIREISIWRNDKKKVSQIVSTVLTVKSFFALLSFIIFLTAVLLIPRLKEHKWLFFATFGFLIDSAINPRFYFQGIEKMKFITYLTLTSRLFFLISIFVFVVKPGHYVWVPALTSLGAITASIIGLYIIFAKHKLKPLRPDFSGIKETLKNSFPFFSSRVSVLAINRTNILLIGTFIGYGEVAYYDLAEKLVGVMKMPFNIFNQVLFPNVSRTKNIQLVKKILILLLGVYIVGYLSLYILAEPVIKIIGGTELVHAKFVLFILGVTAITELASVFMGAPMLLAMGYKKQYNESIIWGSVFYLCLVGCLYIFSLITIYFLTLSTVLASSFILIYRFWFCKKYKIL